MNVKLIMQILLMWILIQIDYNRNNKIKFINLFLRKSFLFLFHAIVLNK